MEVYDTSAGYGDVFPTGGAGIIPGTTNNADPNSAFPITGSFGIAEGQGTGQHGITPVLDMSGGVGGAITGVWDWLNRPFTQPMSPMALALAVGVVLVAILFWNFVLYHIRIAAETI